MIFILWYKPLFSCFIISSTIPPQAPLPQNKCNIPSKCTPTPSLINAKKNLFENARKKLMKNYSYLWWTDCLFLSSEKIWKLDFSVIYLCQKTLYNVHLAMLLLWQFSGCHFVVTSGQIVA